MMMMMMMMMMNCFCGMVDRGRTFTLGCLIQKEGCLLIFRFFLTHHTLLRPPRLLILAKDVKSLVLFLCIKDRRQNLCGVLPILAVV